MKQKIIDILLKHSSELKIKSAILNEPDIEEWLWSGDYETVANEILHLFDVSNSLPKTNACTCWKCMGLEKDPYEDDGNDC